MAFAGSIVTKASDTEIIRTTTQTQEQRISLKELKKLLVDIQARKVQLDAQFDAQISSLTKNISDAEAQGVYE